MLTLKRRCGEKIMLDTPAGVVVIELVYAHRNYARLGFIAPKEVGVWREELWVEKQGESTQATSQDEAEPGGNRGPGTTRSRKVATGD